VAGTATTFAALTGSARAAEVVVDFFPAPGAMLAEDALMAEETNLASVTFLVCSVEFVPVAFLPPAVASLVFAIASPFRLC
jgi:hypothetical protein